MKKPYLTLEGMSVKASHPQLGWQQISEKEYIEIRDQKNKEFQEKQKEIDEQMMPVLEENKLIIERIRKIARDQLIEEGILEA